MPFPRCRIRTRLHNRPVPPATCHRHPADDDDAPAPQSVEDGLILTPSLPLALKLLPMTTLELSETLNQELVENPLLEEGPSRHVSIIWLPIAGCCVRVSCASLRIEYSVSVLQGI